jgi:hypothetical protein
LSTNSAPRTNTRVAPTPARTTAAPASFPSSVLARPVLPQQDRNPPFAPRPSPAPPNGYGRPATAPPGDQPKNRQSTPYPPARLPTVNEVALQATPEGNTEQETLKAEHLEEEDIPNDLDSEN